MGIEIPQKYGGAGMSFLASCLAVEEMAKVDASVAVLLDVQNTLVNNVFAKWANDDIKERAWTRLASTTVGSFALSEPGSGSDAFALKTRAEKKGDYYVINGRFVDASLVDYTLSLSLHKYTHTSGYVEPFSTASLGLQMEAKLASFW